MKRAILYIGILGVSGPLSGIIFGIIFRSLFPLLFGLSLWAIAIMIIFMMLCISKTNK